MGFTGKQVMSNKLDGFINLVILLGYSFSEKGRSLLHID
jgi:hypothetical protein